MAVHSDVPRHEASSGNGLLPDGTKPLPEKNIDI